MNWSEGIIFISALGFWAYLLIKIIDWFVEWDTQRIVKRWQNQKSKIMEEAEKDYKLIKIESRIDAFEKQMKGMNARIEKLEQFKIDSELSLPIVADRIEKLEKRRK